MDTQDMYKFLAGEALGEIVASMSGCNGLAEDIVNSTSGGMISGAVALCGAMVVGMIVPQVVADIVCGVIGVRDS